MAWRPGGNIAAVAQYRDKRVVAFYEKNGLKHQEFDLPPEAKIIRDLTWNSDGSVLAIIASEVILFK